MNTHIHMHDVVALLQDTTTTHFDTKCPILLRRGQMGTVVLLYDGNACEVEFSDRDGRAYALLPIAEDKIMVLRDAPEFVSS